MSKIIVRSDLENIISIPSDQYENNLQQELEELILVESEDESDNETDSISYIEDGIDEDSAADPDLKFLYLDEIKSQSNSSGKLTLYLTEEEQGIIDNCTDPKLKQLLLINRTKALHIKELCKKLHRVYDDLGVNIRKEREKFRQEKNMVEHPELQSMAKTYIWRIGMPFFKDKSFYSAPPNRDLARKKENKEFFATKVVEGRKWTEEDQQILRDSVLGNYYKHRESRLEQDIRLLKVRIRNATDGMVEAEAQGQLEKSEKKLEKLKLTKSEPPPFNTDEGIDWLKIATFDLKARHTYLECKAFWNIYLHPSINKTDWLPEENDKIKELAIAYNYDWDVIAKELNTNRSPYLICVHYNTKLCDKFRRQRFLPEEDEFLLEVVQNCRLGDYIPWGRVAYYFEDRSKHQLYHRYRYYLSCKNVKKGTFTEAEDILLTYLTEKFGKDFSRIAELIPQRTSIQLRNRYSNYLQKLNIQLGNFTYADDKRILNHVEEYGHKSWSALARDLKRTRAHVRQRYLTLRKCMEKYPDLAIDSLPRRKQAFLSRCQVTKNSRMATCLEKLKELQGIPTLATVEMFVKQIDQELAKKEKELRVLKAPVRRIRSDVDRKLIEFFKGSCKFQREKKALDERAAMDSARRIIKLFEALGADVKLLKESEVEDNCFVLDHDEAILNAIKKVLLGNNVKLDSVRKNSFISEPVQANAAAVPGPSRLDPLSLDLPKQTVKHLLPPSVNTVLGLRGMIIKYQVYKTANKNLTSIVKIESTKPGPEDPMVWKIERNLFAHDAFTRARIQEERELFYKRFWAVLKWPCIISKNFPERLTKTEDDNQEAEEEEEGVIEEQQEKRKAGRPPRKIYTKVLKMVEAKKRKRTDNDEAKKTDEVIDCDEITEEVAEPTPNNVASETEPKKPKRGRPPNKSKSEHAVAYIPRRSHVKLIKANGKTTEEEEEEEEMNVDDPNNDSEATSKESKGSIDDLPDISAQTIENKSKVSTPLTTQRIINVSDLKLLNSNAIVLNKDKINNLIKLNKFKNAKKIIVLQGPNQKFIANANGKHIITPPKNETPEDTEFQQEVSPSTSNLPQNTVLNEIHTEVTINNKESNTESQNEIPKDTEFQQEVIPSTSNLPQKAVLKEIHTEVTINNKESNTESQNEIPEDTEFQQEVSPSTSNLPQNTVLKEIHTEVTINQKESNTESLQNGNRQMICISKQQWNSYLEKWKKLSLPEAEKEMLEQDLRKIEKEAAVTKSEINTAEQNEDVDAMFNIKAEDIWQEPEGEINNINEQLSQELAPFREYERVVNDFDNCNKEAKAVIETNMKKNTLKLSATIERMRKKMKHSLNNSQ